MFKFFLYHHNVCNSIRINFFKKNLFNEIFLMNFINLAWILATWNVFHVSSGNQTMVACVRVLGSEYSWIFLSRKRIPWYSIVSSFKSRVSCTFFNWIFQSKKMFFFLLFLVFFLYQLCISRECWFGCVVSSLLFGSKVKRPRAPIPIFFV